MIVVETLEQAQSVLSSIDRVIVCFMARWCPPCRMINLSLEEFSTSNSNVPIYKIDVHEFKELAQNMKATSVPVTLIIEKGQIVSSRNGYLDANELTKIYYNKE
jgi:thiol-disulfide isomerase/thioredoxin